MRLTHKEVAWILRITQDEALSKIILIDHPDPDEAQKVWEKTVKQSVDSEEFDKKYGTSLTFAANDIVNNCIKRPAYKRWLFIDWPKKLLDSSSPPEKIQLPTHLRRLVSEQDKETIKRYWEQNLSMYVSPYWTVKYTPIFEP